MTCKKYWLFGGILLGFYGNINPVYGQIIPDNTTNTSINNSCQSTCNINGGELAGQNLFHSFSEFNVGIEESVYFADPGVTNIFNRVTGSNSSQISGILGISGGDANLWLLNPNGIIFGEGAALDINGSFIATTADKIQFGNDDSFSALPDAQENLALLTINPSALFFNQIEQQGSILINKSNLTVSPGQNIALLGQGVDENPGILLQNSSLNAPEGNINLGTTQSETKIGIDANFKLTFPQDSLKGDITLAQGSVLEASGMTNGTINVQGDFVTLSEDSAIVINNFGDFNSGEINLKASNLLIKGNSAIIGFAFGAGNSADINLKGEKSVKVVGEDNSVFQQFLLQNIQLKDNSIVNTSNIQTLTQGSGDAGNIRIESQNLAINNGAKVISSTFGRGNTGNIDVNVLDTLEISGSGLLTGSTALSPGEVGEININTDILSVTQGGIISSSTLGDGNAGNLNIRASSLIEMKDTPANSFIPTGIYSNAVWGIGKGGNLSIDTPKLILKNGSFISASSGGVTSSGSVPFGGRGGNITINASESLNISGVSVDGRFSSSILSDTRSDSSAGDLIINTGSLVLDNKGFVSASSLGAGGGGDIFINATESIDLSGGNVSNLQQLLTDGLQGKLRIESIKGGIAALTVTEGNAGDITVKTPQLNLENGAIISTATFGKDDAGRLKIDASESIDLMGSAIISPTFGDGNAGKIELNTKNLNALGGSAIASASVSNGNAGDISIFASESINLEDIIPNLLFSGSISTGTYGGRGFSGDLTIGTQRLSIGGGANIETNNIALELLGDRQNSSPAKENRTFPKGKLIINAFESIKIFGATAEKNPFNISSSSRISSTTSTSIPASDITINTGKLAIYDRGEVSVNSLGMGSAGTLEIEADSLSLEDRGRLNGTTLFGQGGNINLKINNILKLSDRSIIDTNAFGNGNGSNINIDTKFVVASEESIISANALSGQGGNINIEATDLFITPDSQITASSKLGIDGRVDIKIFSANEQNNLVKLPEKTVKADTAIIRSCGNKNGHKGVFSYTGRGGLPPSPLTEYHVGDRALIPDLSSDDESLENKELDLEKAEISSLPKATVEASTWKINHKGKIELVAQIEQDTISKMLDNSKCPWLNRKS